MEANDQDNSSRQTHTSSDVWLIQNYEKKKVTCFTVQDTNWMTEVRDYVANTDNITQRGTQLLTILDRNMTNSTFLL